MSENADSWWSTRIIASLSTRIASLSTIATAVPIDRLAGQGIPLRKITGVKYRDNRLFPLLG